MKKKNLWSKRIMAVAICAAMAAEPAVIYAEDFSDGFYSENEEWENPEETQTELQGEEQTEAPSEEKAEEQPEEQPEEQEAETKNAVDSENHWDESDADLLLNGESGEGNLSDFSSEDSAELVTDEEGFYGAAEENGETDALILAKDWRDGNGEL